MKFDLVGRYAPPLRIVFLMQWFIIELKYNTSITTTYLTTVQ